MSEVDESLRGLLEGWKVVSLSVEERGELLDDTQWFSDWSWVHLEELAKHIAVLHAGEGSILFEQGDDSRFMALLVKGRIQLIKEDAGGGERELASLGENKSLGELALLDAEPRSATARVQHTVTMIVITLERFERLQQVAPETWGLLSYKLAQLVSRRLRLMTGLWVEHLNEESGEGV